LGSIILSAALLLGLTGCSEEKKAVTSAPPPEVEVAEAVQEDVPVYREWVASMDGLVNATIVAQVQGYLIKRNYQEGEFVKKGSLPAVPAGVPSDLLERRPDIRQAEQLLSAANARIGVAKSLYFPTISLTGAFGTAGTGLSNLLSAAYRTWNFGVPVSAPLLPPAASAAKSKRPNPPCRRRCALTSRPSRTRSARSTTRCSTVANPSIGSNR
jgi:hypothetical protein